MKILNDNIELLKRAINTYGEKEQMVVAMEEMDELGKELCKSYRGRNNRKNIIEEIADVCIILAQALLIHRISIKEIVDEIAFKLNRLEARLDGKELEE